MKRLLLPLLAALALPTAVNAETWWLMANGTYLNGSGTTSSNWSIPTNSEIECEAAGQKFINNDWKKMLDRPRYVCVKGK